jgi:type VI secretion system FHA domain protein
MTLTLTLANVDRLENNQSTRLVLDRHGALIGRSPSADWSLPDPKNHISNSHCEIAYRNGSYILNDTSTNGTYVNNARERLSGPYTLANGDELAIGHYRILVHIADPGGAPAPAKAEPAPQGWVGWDEAPAPQPADDGWGDVVAEAKPAPQWTLDTPGAAITGRGPLRDNFAPPRAIEAPARDDVWSRFAASNAIDWQSAGAAAPAPSRASSWPPERRSDGAPAPWPEAAAPREAPPPPPPVQAPRPAPPAAEPRGAEPAWNAFLAAAGVKAGDLKAPPSQSGAAAGSAMRQLVAGLIVLLEARARAKAELGALSTTIELAGNNPLKFTRDPEAAVARLLNPPERGFMEAERAVDDAFKDLQAHQMATLAAMQGALRATLTRFSPDAIRARAETHGLLARILPNARAATLWDAYEREFEGVVKGSDEAFMDTFARAFRDAYQKASAEMRR